MNSHNHHMFGSIDAWFYRWLAGIQVVEPGFKKFVVKPPVIKGLDHVSAKIYTVKGLVNVAWRNNGETFELTINVPVGSIAEIHLPKIEKEIEIFEGGRSIWKNGKLSIVEGIISAREEKDRIVIEIGSGSYSFELKRLSTKI